jgi:hypothetical protein
MMSVRNSCGGGKWRLQSLLVTKVKELKEAGGEAKRSEEGDKRKRVSSQWDRRWQVFVWKFRG